MSLDRYIALALLVFCIIYGYTAFFTMDALLPPFMKFNPIWPSTFPKILSILGAICALAILFNAEKSSTPSSGDIDYRRLGDYKITQALVLLAIMTAYALLLRPLGFFISTIAFLTLSSFTLGERRLIVLFIISTLAASGIWYLVQSVLGIYLSPLPPFIIAGT